MIEVTGVSKRYRGTPVLDGATLTLNRGEKGLLLGSNGAGKSTLLRVIAGLLPPDAGSVSIDGLESARDRRATATLIGYAGHASLVYGDLTAEENLRFSAGLYGLGSDAAASHVEASLVLVGLTDQRRKRARALSQGQLRRLALARALVHDPPVLLLDEPFAALDGEGRGRLVAWLAADRERTVLLATHQLDFRPEGADQIFHLDGGRIRAHPGHKSATSGDALPHDGVRNGRAAGAAGAAGEVNGHRPPAMECVRLIAAKDLRIEWRSRLRLQSLLLFSATLALIVGYGLRDSAALEAALPVGVWLLTVFLQLLFLAQAYRAEMEHGCFEGLLLAPIPRGSIALAKTLVGALLAVPPTLVGLGVLAWLSGSAQVLAPAVLLALGIETVGIVGAGTLVFATTAAGDEPAPDLYALVLLAVLPLVFFGQDLTREHFAGMAFGELLPKLGVLAAYAAVLVLGAALAYAAFSRPDQR